MANEVQTNEQDRVIRPGELTFTDEWAGTRVERTDSKYGNERFYAVDGVGEYRSVTSSLSVINKPALADWRKNKALDKMLLMMNDNKEQRRYQKLADEKNAKARIHKNNTAASMMVADAKKAPTQLMETARDFGTYAHSVVEHIAIADANDERLGRNVDRSAESFVIGPEYAHIAEGFKMWLQDSGMTVVATEIMVWHSFYEYAGTIDLVCRNKDGMLAVVDIKTGGIYNEAAMQLAAYAKALQHLTGEEVAEVWALRLPRERGKDSGDQFYEAHQLDDVPYWLDTFMAAHLLTPLVEKQAWQTT
mgnify:CR=1 FL=1